MNDTTNTPEAAFTAIGVNPLYVETSDGEAAQPEAPVEDGKTYDGTNAA